MMKEQFWNIWNRNPEKGGLIGALVGLLIAYKTIHRDDSPVKKAGKAAAYAGAGFITGRWIEKWISNKTIHS